MPQTKLGRFIDNISIAFCSTIVFLVWIKKIINNAYISLFISMSLSFILIKIIKHFQNKKLKKLNIKKEETNNILQCNKALRMMQLNKQVSFIKKLFKNQKVKQKNFMLFTEDYCIINQLNNDLTTTEKIYESYQNMQNLKNENIKNIIIIGNKISPEANLLMGEFNNIKIEFISPIELYSLMKNANKYPCTINQKTQKNKFKLQIKPLFMKKSAKLFFRCGLLLYISSLFVPYFKYYIISASILLILSIICLIFGKKEQLNLSLIEKIKQSI